MLFCVGLKSCFQWFQMWKQLSDVPQSCPRRSCGRAYFRSSEALAVRVSAPFCCLGAHCCPVLGSAQLGPGAGCPGLRARLSITCWKPGRVSAWGQAGLCQRSGWRLSLGVEGKVLMDSGFRWLDLSRSCLSTTDGGAAWLQPQPPGSFCQVRAPRRLPASVLRAAAPRAL